MMTEDRLKEIEERAAAATPGPWNAGIWEGEGWHAVFLHPLVPVIADLGGDEQDKENAAFIAAARADVPDLVAEVRKVRWLFADFQKQIEEMQACIDAAGKALIGDGVISDLYAVGDALESYYSVRDAGVLPTSEAVLSGRTSRDDELSKLRAILTELVDLKELKESNIGGPNYAWASEYSRRKPAAWAAAREALGREG